MKRIIYKVWWATADENQNGIYHASEPFKTEKEAQKFAKQKWETADFVSIDKRHEIYEDYDWRQQDGTETEIIEVE